MKRPAQRPPPAGLSGPDVVTFKGVILGHYESAKGTRRAFDLRQRRLDELHALIRHRHGVDRLGFNEVAMAYAEFAAHHIREPNRIASWLDLWSPEIPGPMRLDIVARAMSEPRRWTADQAGAWLGVWMAERETLNLTTIGAQDMTRRRRQALAKERKRERDRQAARLKRAAAGTVRRADYLSSANATKAEAERLGISARALRKRRQRLAELELVPPFVATYRMYIGRDEPRNYFTGAAMEPRIITFRPTPRSAPISADVAQLEPVTARLIRATRAWLSARQEWLDAVEAYRRSEEAALSGPRRKPGRKPRQSKT